MIYCTRNYDKDSCSQIELIAGTHIVLEYSYAHKNTVEGLCGNMNDLPEDTENEYSGNFPISLVDKFDYGSNCDHDYDHNNPECTEITVRTYF